MLRDPLVDLPQVLGGPVAAALDAVERDLVGPVDVVVGAGVTAPALDHVRLRPLQRVAVRLQRPAHRAELARQLDHAGVQAAELELRLVRRRALVVLGQLGGLRLEVRGELVQQRLGGLVVQPRELDRGRVRRVDHVPDLTDRVPEHALHEPGLVHRRVDRLVAVAESEALCLGLVSHGALLSSQA
ncbi:hypothetical protein ACFQ0B_03270 [Nonomuraea thailandensis]